MQEEVKICGVVTIKTTNAEGLVVAEDHHNMVVTAGKNLLAKRLAGDSTQNITKIVFGTGSTAAAITDTAMVSPSSPAYNISYTYPSSTSVRFTASMAHGEGNGNSFTEMGLTTAAGVLFSRLVLQAPVVKTSEYALDIDWTISFQ
jgi:hypothetical protein